MVNYCFCFQAVPPEEDGDPGPLQPCQMLRYSLHKNLASIATQRGDENEAMEQYLEVMSLFSCVTLRISPVLYLLLQFDWAT